MSSEVRSHNITWNVHQQLQDNYLRATLRRPLRTGAPSGLRCPASVSITTQNSSASQTARISQFKQVTPRGSTDYHGSLFEFRPHNVFDANSFFNNAKRPSEKETTHPQSIRLWVGGPIKFPKKAFGPLVCLRHRKAFFLLCIHGETRRPGAAL
jgi:hypothetical protein